ncbi:MAG: DUF6232 family protein [Cyanobacteria bacterium J06650_10]
MSRRRSKESEPKYLSISKRTIRFGSRVYQLRNVTNIAMLTINPTYISTIQGFLVSGILFLILISIDNFVSKLLGILALLSFGLGIYERVSKKPEYALQIETSSGSQNLISSSDKAFIKNIISKIYMFMDDEEQDAKYVFNLEDRSISVKGDVTESVLLSGDAHGSFISETPYSKPSSPRPSTCDPPRKRKSRLRGTGLSNKGKP